MDESKENRSPVFRFPKMMQTRTSVGIEEASISRDIQAHEDRKDQKKLVVQVIRTLLGGKWHRMMSWMVMAAIRKSVL